ncbi:MAG TPA: Rne/Rng family ribonuclease [Candidatus Saccharimonadales bacterium]|nr:Rne/Rng family ribonuclease [Candidatus Saccharimonadales bacterium]
MFKEIVINADPHETRVAVLEDRELTEILVERADRPHMVGDIFKGKVNAVLPGMQAAFVDLGLPKTAFLHVSDLAESLKDIDDLSDLEEHRRRGKRKASQLKIEDFLEKGEEILVQVTKEPISTKGARVTQQISLPGRFVVFMPGVDHVGVSRKIEGREERTRLKQIITEIKPPNAGLIVRTAGEGKSKKDFGSDVKNLAKLWAKIDKKAVLAKAPVVINSEMDLSIGLIRDLFTEDVNQVTVDSKEVYEQVLDYLKTFSPELRSRVKQFKGGKPIFDHFGIETEIEKLMQRKVWLKKGGYLTIDQAEALVAIDVNTGRFTGRKNQEDTIFKTNMEAAREVARQLRLRDLGGIIVIDFIDMEVEANKRAVLDELRSALKGDRSRTKTFEVSALGLVEMTRQRQGPSLFHYFTEDCPTCGGSGKVYSLESILRRLERLLRRVGVGSRERTIQIKLNPEVAVYVLEDNNHRIEALEKQYKLRIDFKDDPQLKREDLRIIQAKTGNDITKQFEQ